MRLTIQTKYDSDIKVLLQVVVLNLHFGTCRTTCFATHFESTIPQQVHSNCNVLYVCVCNLMATFFVGKRYTKTFV